ncbi:MAG: sigma-70 family RNA polymerase sigma factor [Pseudomonadota bacterium]
MDKKARIDLGFPTVVDDGGTAACDGSAAPASEVTPPGELDLNGLYMQSIAPLIALLRKSFGKGPPDPEDIAHQAFQRVLERGGLEDVRNQQAFLWQIARNLTLNEMRSQDVHSRYNYEIEQLYFPDRGDGFDPERVIQAKDQIKRINQLLGTMPERRRRAFLLHRVEGLSLTAVAERLHISRTAASKHVSKAVAELDAVLERDSSG